MADERGYDLASTITTEDGDVFFNVDKAGFARSKQYKQSVLKGHFKVGDQQYTEENYVSNDETLTTSVDGLDMALKALSDTVASVTSVKAIKLSLTSGQVAALGTAVELFSAGGADTSYQLIDIKWAVNPATVLDVGGQNLEIYFEDETNYLAMIREPYLQSPTRLVKGVQIQAEHELKMNKKIYCKLSGSSNPSSGSATMDFWFIYQSIAVSPVS